MARTPVAVRVRRAGTRLLGHLFQFVLALVAAAALGTAVYIAGKHAPEAGLTYKISGACALVIAAAVLATVAASAKGVGDPGELGLWSGLALVVDALALCACVPLIVICGGTAAMWGAFAGAVVAVVAWGVWAQWWPHRCAKLWAHTL